MRKRITIIAALFAVLVTSLALTGCGKSNADVASHNISVEAEQFKIARRIVFFNGITDKYLAEVDGYCSVETGSSHLSGSLEVTCKLGKGQYKKSYFGPSDNVSYMVQQIDPIDVSVTRYKVIFKPETIVPDFDRPQPK